MQSLLLVRQCRHPAVHRMRLYIWIHPSHPPFWFEHSKLLLVKKNMDMYERIAFIKSSHVLGSCDKSRIFLIPKRREGGGGGVCGKKFFLGKTRFKSYLTINQSQKLKLIFFSHFPDWLGGSTQVVSLTAFSVCFFYRFLIVSMDYLGIWRFEARAVGECAL